MAKQLESFYNECMSQLQAESSKIENVIVTEKEFNVLIKNGDIAKNIIDKVQFYSTRIKQTCVVGDKVLYEYVLPDTVTE